MSVYVETMNEGEIHVQSSPGDQLLHSHETAKPTTAHGSDRTALTKILLGVPKTFVKKYVVRHEESSCFFYKQQHVEIYHVEHLLANRWK